MIRIRHYILPLMVMFAPLFSASASGSETAAEAQIRAAILFNLIRFSHWTIIPIETEHDNFTFCTHANPEMESSISDLGGKEIHRKFMVIQHLSAKSPNYEECKVIYISKGHEPEDRSLKHITDHNILIIGDTPEILAMGAHMSIQRDDSRMRFSINYEAMKAIHIRPSSKILNLAVEPSQ